MKTLKRLKRSKSAWTLSRTSFAAMTQRIHLLSRLESSIWQSKVKTWSICRVTRMTVHYPLCKISPKMATKSLITANLKLMVMKSRKLMKTLADSYRIRVRGKIWTLSRSLSRIEMWVREPCPGNKMIAKTTLKKTS